MKEERKIEKVKEQWLYNQSICSEGIRFSDAKSGLTNSWVMFTPVDLSQDGQQEFKLVIGNSRYAGTVTVNVRDGKVTVDYKLNQLVTKRDMAFTLLPDLAGAESLDAKSLKAYEFGKEISVADDLGGDTSVLLYVFGHGNYDFAQSLMDWFLPNSAGYRQLVTRYQGMME